MASPKKAFPTTLTKDNVSALLDSIDTVMFDCDGVLWTYDRPLEGAAALVKLLQERGKRVFLVTNNAMRSTLAYREKCQKLGFDVTQDQILSSSAILASHLRQQGFSKKVYLVGPAGVAEELGAAGIQCVGVGPDPMESDLFTLGRHTKFEEGVGAVVVSMDVHFSLPKVFKAAGYLCQDPSCLFLATDLDASYPMPMRKLLFPASACMVRGVEAVVGRQATVMGKPETRAFEMLQREFGCRPEKTLMVGDTLHTDMLMAARCGVRSLHVATGVHSAEDIRRRVDSGDAASQQQVPDYCLPSVGAMLGLLQ